MKEIRVHARAGQGAITTATILANAAFEDNKYALTFPPFGAARMGAPMNAFVRIGDAPIRVRSQIYTPDYVLVQDPTLLRGYDVVAGLCAGLGDHGGSPLQFRAGTEGRPYKSVSARCAKRRLRNCAMSFDSTLQVALPG
ncbi:MAG: 2-oxoacid:acceptor oxidoreductase family protein, partial [Dehalococcoidia bacterium]